MGSQPARRTGWLYRIPPWRAPRMRRHHHHHHHDASHDLAVAIGGFFVALLFVELWFAEVMIWLMLWYYYALFLGARWLWRHNPLGQTIDTFHAAKERRRPRPYDPHGAPPQPVDLGQLGDMRRRS